jgi:hypothetical protein
MSIKINPELLKVAKAVRQAQAINEILSKGEMDDNDMRKLLKTVGIKDEHINEIMEAKKKYDETGDPEPVIEAVAAAFGIPADELKKWVASVDIIGTILRLT